MSAAESYRLVMSAVAETNQDVALERLVEAHRLDGANKLALYHIGVIYAGRGLHHQAARSFKEVLDTIDGEDPGIWFLLARQLHLSRDHASAVEAYEKTVQLDPLCEKAYLYMSLILSADKREPARAAKYAETALLLRPEKCMVPVSEFEEALAHARSATPHAETPPIADDTVLLAKSTLGGLTIRGSEVLAILERHGINCSACAGYDQQLLADAAREAGADLRQLEQELIISMREGTRR